MGQIAFQTPYADNLSQSAVERAYLIGYDGIPIPARNSSDGTRLIVHQSIDESGYLQIPWVIDGIGEVMLSTTSMMSSPVPYHLELELARGSLNRLRNHVAAGQLAEFEIPELTTKLLGEANSDFADTLMNRNQPEVAAELAHKVIKSCLQAIGELVKSFSLQTMQHVKQQGNAVDKLVGVRVDGANSNEEIQQVLSGCNCVNLTTRWREIEPNTEDLVWDSLDEQLRIAQESGSKVLAGPLITLNPRDIPEWAYLWEEDFQNLRGYVTNYVATVVRRYLGSVHVWYATSRMITGQGLSIDEEQRIQLAADVIRTIREIDPQTPIVIGFDQPWAEYLARRESLSPFHFLDTLIRNNVGVAGVALHLDWGYWPGGSGCRDLLEVSNQIDRWSIFQLPILMYVTAPTSCDSDQLAWSAARPVQPCGWNDQKLQPLQELLHLLIAKPSVHALIWNCLSDQIAHEFQRSGFLDEFGSPKNLLKMWSTLKLAFGY